MSAILVTGSTEGLGRHTAEALLDQGHRVVVHARTTTRLTALQDLLDRGVQAVVGDLADHEQVLDLAHQADELGPFDVVIHNAGVIRGPSVLPVNVVAPYELTARMERPGRLVYLSSDMHYRGRADLAGVDWSGSGQSRSYSDSKLYVTAFAAALARLWPAVLVHAVDPGWVPTRMGGPGATDDLREGHLTQAWLATTDDPHALVSGRYWHHQHTQEPHLAVHDEGFQEELLESLAAHTGVTLAPR
ncbi:SDR family NAD(P)-dependent oxidoreductase [Nocardiopsis sp. CT-R113]|uniref:SDR family NAD(P)-dependent oxidoreductase n=1 Tax=Nocardiopsis codii TaxID=3065942 RepID=A0ABU7KD27_9ACTN|nr:SDR family NAD(P)-dependent oxidoreductase [Nocardiopsis sp. CT-R113]MEE2039507.1 SDR family NAD(P)-dependent oxidoreductase [Nocardiopsis sp. CT-R113]